MKDYVYLNLYPQRFKLGRQKQSFQVGIFFMENNFFDGKEVNSFTKN